MNYSGGYNKTHGQIERTYRIDSFEVGSVEGRGIVIASGGGQTLPLRYEHYGMDEQELVELSYPGSRWRDCLMLDRVRSGFGGSRAFWLCPRCGRRARYLYFKGRGFVCRGCAMLNYHTQQRTRGCINHYRDGLKLAREKLGWEPPDWLTPLDFPHVEPDKPPYMHWTTYRRYLARFRRYQAAYRRDSLREMMSILRR